MHTGNVENGDAFQGDAAEVQSHAITLLEEEETFIRCFQALSHILDRSKL